MKIKVSQWLITTIFLGTYIALHLLSNKAGFITVCFVTAETTGRSFEKRCKPNRWQGIKLVRASSFLVQYSNKIIRIAQEVERYLLKHPYAADSLQGIVKWWIKRQRFEESFDHIQQALDFLIARGSIHKIKNADGIYIYKKKKEDKEMGSGCLGGVAE